jgi:hypothetical protein
MLPWDVWGIMPQPGETLDEETIRRFDDLSLRTRDPETFFRNVRVLYDTIQLKVPPVVFNAVRQKPEPV